MLPGTPVALNNKRHAPTQTAEAARIDGVWVAVMGCFNGEVERQRA